MGQYFDFIPLREFKRRNPEEYNRKVMLCQVNFDDMKTDKTYTYISDYPELKKFDYVSVPVGEEHNKLVGIVASVDFIYPKDALFAINKLKHIDEIIDTDSIVIDEDSDVVGFGNL